MLPFSLFIFLVILYYDYTLTLPAEVQRFWSSPLSWAPSFFYVNRYLALFGHIPVMIQYYWDSRHSNTEEMFFFFFFCIILFCSRRIAPLVQFTCGQVVSYSKYVGPRMPHPPAMRRMSEPAYPPPF
ncbi:hypothetical protein FPV67DRAFT_804090 [Lyophyllum atratum]|nr:hypothetical protein FPV67DRAFT_804090 [Lyophyllum atratum]